jgi:hypothetical protein
VLFFLFLVLFSLWIGRLVRRFTEHGFLVITTPAAVQQKLKAALDAVLLNLEAAETENRTESSHIGYAVLVLLLFL